MSFASRPPRSSVSEALDRVTVLRELPVFILRVGGITPMLRAFALIEAKNLPVAPHHFPELMTPLLGASPNALSIEYLPYFVHGMFEQAPVIDRGMIRPLDVPGRGIRFHPDVLKTAQ
jgi:L-alanine-DL-glutamate epimerase-like enolase superfamily enzyme